MTTSTKLSGAAMAPRPPAKGSFPLDHLSECKDFAIAYERCLRVNEKVTGKCRKAARAYLECRMERGLMAREEWKKLGLSQIDDSGGDMQSKNEDVRDGPSETGRLKPDKSTVERGT